MKRLAKFLFDERHRAVPVKKVSPQALGRQSIKKFHGQVDLFFSNLKGRGEIEDILIVSPYPELNRNSFRFSQARLLSLREEFFGLILGRA
jgi:hypothetical protein